STRGRIFSGFRRIRGSAHKKRIIHKRRTRYSVHMALVENNRVGFDYTILEELEAGLELLGFEVKSLRAGRGSLKGARVVARGSEAYLVGASIPPWQQGNTPKSYEPERTRRLLLPLKGKKG